MSANLDKHRLLRAFTGWRSRLPRRVPAHSAGSAFAKPRPQSHVTRQSRHSLSGAAPRIWNSRFIGPPVFSRDFELPAQLQQPTVY